MLPLNWTIFKTLPLKILLASLPGGTEIDTPLLFIVVVLTTGCLWVPNLWLTTPFSTGQGNFPLFEEKLAASAFASGVNTKLSEFFPAF